MHPTDHRPIFAIPWEGATIVGTTDLDHRQDFLAEPAIELAEAEYLLSGAQEMFPELNLSMADCVSTWAGVRPVLSFSSRALGPSISTGSTRPI